MKDTTHLATDLDIDAELARFEAEERARLGLDAETEHWTDEMVDPQFAASERAETTLLVGGLTMAHDFLVEGALSGQGYRVRAIDVPDNESLRYGKEFGNRGQCNPTYFTVGNLIKELDQIRAADGLTHQQVIDRYIFFTCGACGPCRFGMYVTEYRKALRDAGYDGFRVMLFQQTGGLKQATGEDAGLVLDPPFFIAILKAILAGDVINLLGYRIRPYEVDAGATDRALTRVKQLVYDALAQRRSVVRALWRGRRIMGAVVVDRTHAKPKVTVLGEFWAMMTEGDGSYRLQRWLEEEGAEVDIQIIAALLLYNLWEFRDGTKQRARLRGADQSKFGLADKDVGRTLAGVYLAELALRGVFQTFALALGLRGYQLPDMDEVARVGHSHYNTELRGGEGHLEVAKTILNVIHHKSHMTISIKPFGCMPSSGVSDGIQSVVTERYPEAIFCAVETSGDGAVNFYSRVQMFLFKAKQRAEQEMADALAAHGLTREQAQAYLAGDGAGYAGALYRAPHVFAGSAADLIEHIGPLVGRRRGERVVVHARRLGRRVQRLVAKDVPGVYGKAREIVPYLPALARWVGGESVPAGTPARLAPLASWVGRFRAWSEGLLAPTPAERAQIDRAEATEPLPWATELPPGTRIVAV